MTRTRGTLIFARLVAAIFSATFFPALCFVILFTMTFYNLLPRDVKLWILSLVCIGTMLLPAMITGLYHHIRSHFGHHALLRRRDQIIPHIVHIACYLFTLHQLNSVHVPRIMTLVIFGSLVLQVLCLVIAIFWRISNQTAGIGAFIGMLFIYSELFRFYPITWICWALLAFGLVGSCLVYLRVHTVPQVTGGLLLGVVVSYKVLDWSIKSQEILDYISF